MSEALPSRRFPDRTGSEDYPFVPGVLELRLGGGTVKGMLGAVRPDDEGSADDVTAALGRLAGLLSELSPNYEPHWDTYVREANLRIRGSKLAGKPAKVRIKRDGRDYVFVARDANNYYVEESND